jgi:NADH:ubiquinone oxidoreductase subunit 6 (subunit J)
MATALANPINQLILGVLLGFAGVYLLLPQAKRRSVTLGTFLCIASMAVLGIFLAKTLGKPVQDAVGEILFWLFSAGAVGFGLMMITQRNPGRGAIAFAFVILSTCGLFLLLAAPFIMAATIIIYAGAIIVTFLFLLMLSHVSGPSDENDRTREPLMGSLAGFAFIGLILFTILQSNSTETPSALPAPPLTSSDRELLASAIVNIDAALKAETREEFVEKMKPAHDSISNALGDDAQTLAGTALPILARRIRLPKDPRQIEFIHAAKKLGKANDEAEGKTVLGKDFAAGKEAATKLRSELIVFAGHGQMPARNVANLGYSLYSEYILAVEMAGTLLLVATIGAVAIAGRRKEVVA